MVSQNETTEGLSIRQPLPSERGATLKLVAPQYASAVRQGTYCNDTVITLTAFVGKRAAGVLLIRVQSEDNEARILWQVVAKEFQGNGIGTQLLQDGITQLKEHNIGTLIYEYFTDQPGLATVQRIFEKCKFSAPSHFGIGCQFFGLTVGKAPWVAKEFNQDDFDLKLWRDIDDSSKAELKETGLEEMNVPSKLSPFRDDEILEKSNSLGLLHDGKIVGWQINHRSSRDTIRYTALFVRDDLKRYGTILPLLGQSIKLQLEMKTIFPLHGYFVVPEEMVQMTKFVQKRFSKYADKMSEIQVSELILDTKCN